MVRPILVFLLMLGGASAFAEETFRIACNQNTVGTSTHAYTVNAPVSKVTWDFLRDYRVLSLIGAKPSEVNLKDKMRKGEFLQVATLDSAFAMLLNARVDYVVMLDAYEAKYWTDRAKVKRTEPVIDQAVYYFVVNRKHQHLVDPLAPAIKDVKEGR